MVKWAVINDTPLPSKRAPHSCIYSIYFRIGNTDKFLWTDGTEFRSFLFHKGYWHPLAHRFRPNSYLQLHNWRGFGLAEVPENYGKDRRGYVCRIFC